MRVVEEESSETDNEVEDHRIHNDCLDLRNYLEVVHRREQGVEDHCNPLDRNRKHVWDLLHDVDCAWAFESVFVLEILSRRCFRLQMKDEFGN